MTCGESQDEECFSPMKLRLYKGGCHEDHGLYSEGKGKRGNEDGACDPDGDLRPEGTAGNRKRESRRGNHLQRPGRERHSLAGLSSEERKPFFSCQHAEHMGAGQAPCAVDPVETENHEKNAQRSGIYGVKRSKKMSFTYYSLVFSAGILLFKLFRWIETKMGCDDSPERKNF